jgi:hypothetical protein
MYFRETAHDAKHLLKNQYKSETQSSFSHLKEK